MSEPILKIEDLQVNYGGIEAVKGISFEVQEGQIVTLIGSNGAGKSSTLRTISGLVKPSGGKIMFAGEDITGKDPTQIVTQGVTLVPEGRRIFPDMTVLENLKIGAYLRKDDLSEDLEWVYSLFPRLKERSWQAGGTLSGGEQQMLAVGRALMSRPKLLMMDVARPRAAGRARYFLHHSGDQQAGRDDPAHRAEREHGAQDRRRRLRARDRTHHADRQRQGAAEQRRGACGIPWCINGYKNRQRRSSAFSEHFLTVRVESCTIP